MKRRGRSIGLSPARRMVGEILRQAQQIPALPQAKRFNLERLLKAREAANSPVSWLAIFMRAYGLTGLRHPPLRQALIRWPYPRLYEHFETVCAVPVERIWEGERILLFPLILAPEHKTLTEIARWLEHFKSAPPQQFGHMREFLRFGRAPWFVRRFAVWHSLHLWGSKRAKRFGTCVVSSVGDLGCEQVSVLTPLTTYLTLGPVDAAGNVTATIVYDHRVMDGRVVAECLNSFEQILNEQMVAELERLRVSAAA